MLFDCIPSPAATVFVNSPETLGARLAGRCDRPFLVPSSWLVVSWRLAVQAVQAAVPLASRRWEVLLAG